MEVCVSSCTGEGTERTHVSLPSLSKEAGMIIIIFKVRTTLDHETDAIEDEAMVQELEV